MIVLLVLLFGVVAASLASTRVIAVEQASQSSRHLGPADHAARVVGQFAASREPRALSRASG